eukprot:1624071-Pleurochrysis_carterae.AAC.1
MSAYLELFFLTVCCVCAHLPTLNLSQLVLLDHGLYSDLPEEFVTMYARLWHGLVLGDAESIRSYSEAMGVG